MPFPRSATQHWLVWGAPFGPVGKRSSAVLHSLELAMASPAVARLAANRFLTGCIPSYYLDGVLVLFQGNKSGFSVPVAAGSTDSQFGARVEGQLLLHLAVERFCLLAVRRWQYDLQHHIEIAVWPVGDATPLQPQFAS